MSVRPRKKIELRMSENKAYQVILNPLVTEKSTQLSEFVYKRCKIMKWTCCIAILRKRL